LGFRRKSARFLKCAAVRSPCSSYIEARIYQFICHGPHPCFFAAFPHGHSCFKCLNLATSSTDVFAPNFTSPVLFSYSSSPGVPLIRVHYFLVLFLTPFWVPPFLSSDLVKVSKILSPNLRLLPERLHCPDFFHLFFVLLSCDLDLWSRCLSASVFRGT